MSRDVSNVSHNLQLNILSFAQYLINKLILYFFLPFYSLENGLTYFHDIRFKGVINGRSISSFVFIKREQKLCILLSLQSLYSITFLIVCKLALYMKFTKYASDGFTALYTRWFFRYFLILSSFILCFQFKCFHSCMLQSLHFLSIKVKSIVPF